MKKSSKKWSGLLNAIGAKNRFRDPIYGYIWLSDDEVKIVDTPIFQRLRRIQQLALTKYIFPTAEHSRFVHSLGVLQCATNIFLELLRKNEEELLENLNDKELIEFFKILRFAALLHDIGHLPFSHAGEKELLPSGFTHEHLSQYIIENDSKIKNILEKNEISTKTVSSLLIGETFIHKYKIIKQIISGVFDADRADYLLRDSYNCGVAYGNYDYIRFVSSFQITTENEQNLSLSVEYGNIQVLEAFLLARHQYNMQIPYHRTRTGIDRIIEEYVKYLKKEKRLPEIIKRNGQHLEVDLKRFVFFDEFEFFQEIKKDYKNILAKILLREEHLVPIMDKVGTEKEINRNYAELIIKLKENDLKENEHFITYKKTGLKIHSLFSGSEEQEEEQNKKNIIKVKDKQGKDLGNIIELSPILKSLEDNSINLFRVYIFKEYKSKASEVLDEYNNHMEKIKTEMK